MFQPYQPQYPQPFGNPYQMQQQPVMVQQQRAIAGRTVGNQSEIVPQEVPMDGSAAYFPVSDGSAIFAKAWNANGTISTVQYVPLTIDEVGSDHQPTIADVLSGIDDLRTLISGISPQEPKQASRTARKAADDASE